jgi:rod shape-determining protein MreD
MTRRVVIVVLVCVAASIVESVVPLVFHLRLARADLLLSAVLYLALNDDVVQGAALSLVAGYLSDLTSATPACLYAVLAVFTFIVVRVVGSAFKTDGGLQSAAIAAVASLIHSTLAAVLFYFVAPGSEGLVLQFAPLFWSAIATAAAAPLVFSVLRRVDAHFLPAESATLVQ